MKLWTAFPIRYLLTALCEQPDLLETAELADAGRAARNLFAFAWEQLPPNPNLRQSGIALVCRTFKSDPAAATACLEKVIAPDNLKSFGHKDLQTLADEVERLVPIGPDFVRNIYRSAFAYKEERTDTTEFGTGRIVPLRSNIRQDYEGALWQLGRAFTTFLKRAPAQAFGALSDVTQAKFVSTQTAVVKIKLAMGAAEFAPDGCHYWDTGGYRHDPVHTMLDAVDQEIARLSGKEAVAEDLERFISSLVSHGKWASLWKHVMRGARIHPDRVHPEIVSLLESVPILSSRDTSDTAGNLIRAVYPHLEKPARERIERAILSIPGTFSEQQATLATRIRDRLLGCIPTGLGALPQSTTLLAEMSKEGGPPPNNPPYEITSSKGGTLTEKDMLARLGIPIEEPANHLLADLAEPVAKFIHSPSDVIMAHDAVVSIFPALRHLAEALETSAAAHPRLRNRIEDQIATCCARMARCPAVNCASEIGQFLKETLLRAATKRLPVADAEAEPPLDEFHEGDSSIRVSAAEGLLSIAIKPQCLDERVSAAVSSLSADPVPAVRCRLAGDLGPLATIAPTLVQELVTRFVQEDRSSSVVLAATHSLAYSFPQNDTEAARLAIIALNRSNLEGKSVSLVRKAAVSLLLDLYCSAGETQSEGVIRNIASNAGRFKEEAQHIVSATRDVLSAGDPEHPDPAIDADRRRSIELLKLILISTNDELTALSAQFRDNPSAWGPNEQARLDAAATLKDNIATQIYFASGAYEEKQGASGDAGAVLSTPRKRRFLVETQELIDLLTLDIPASAVHRLVEMYQRYLDTQPKEVFLNTVKLVKAGRGGGYQFERLGFTATVEVVNRMLADYRVLLQEDRDCRQALIDVVDIFVDAGWAEASQLTYRLEEAYR